MFFPANLRWDYLQFTGIFLWRPDTNYFQMHWLKRKIAGDRIKHIFQILFLFLHIISETLKLFDAKHDFNAVFKNKRTDYFWYSSCCQLHEVYWLYWRSFCLVLPKGIVDCSALCQKQNAGEVFFQIKVCCTSNDRRSAAVSGNVPKK